MMILRKILNLVVLLAAFAAIVGCDRHTQAWEQMDRAEKLLGTKPDSALVILDGISASDVKGKEASARYALLKSIALDKNYIDTTTFDVLQPAIDYYIEKGNPDEKLRTYYYQGRIYQNQGDNYNAMSSFQHACDLKEKVSDTLLLAHTFVAQGALYINQYKLPEYIHNNIEAANLYRSIGKDIFEIKSYRNVIHGYTMMVNKSAADSLISICMPLMKKNPDGEVFLFPSLLSYTINFGSPDDIRAFLGKNQNRELTIDETMDFARGYLKIGDYDKAMGILSNVKPESFIMDSLKYAAIKSFILEKQGKYQQALSAYKDYTALSERYQYNLHSQGMQFAENNYQLEIKNLKEIQIKDRVIWYTLCGIFCLCLIAGWLYYHNHLNRTKRIIVEKENEKLKLEQENLKLEMSKLVDECDNLMELQQKQTELAEPIQDVIKIRLDMLNGLLAKEITNNESYAKPYNKWIESVRNDKKKFMDSTRIAFVASHPKFMEYLEQHNLSIDEINYLCLYAIGLRGKEVGEYIQLKRHYIISHEIRQKLGIDEHETNIGLYIRKLMQDF